MSGPSQTIIKYTDTALPTDGVAVTLFNSAVAFPPGGCFHLLNQQWFQYRLANASAGGTAVGDVTGEFSNDGGVNWTQFYTRATVDAVDSGAPALNEDEVYVGAYKDVRFLYLIDATTEDLTVFLPNLALNCHKPTSKVTVADVLVDG